MNLDKLGTKFGMDEQTAEKYSGGVTLRDSMARKRAQKFSSKR